MQRLKRDINGVVEEKVDELATKLHISWTHTQPIQDHISKFIDEKLQAHHISIMSKASELNESKLEMLSDFNSQVMDQLSRQVQSFNEAYAASFVDSR